MSCFAIIAIIPRSYATPPPSNRPGGVQRLVAAAAHFGIRLMPMKGVLHIYIYIYICMYHLTSKYTNNCTNSSLCTSTATDKNGRVAWSSLTGEFLERILLNYASFLMKALGVEVGVTYTYTIHT